MVRLLVNKIECYYDCIQVGHSTVPGWKSLESSNMKLSQVFIHCENYYCKNLFLFYIIFIVCVSNFRFFQISRFLFFCGGVQFMTELDDEDVIYNPLPLYHTAGGMVGMGQVRFLLLRAWWAWDT